jgi:hypothetical protein
MYSKELLKLIRKDVDNVSYFILRIYILIHIITDRDYNNNKK